jgi:hypothetical protein
MRAAPDQPGRATPASTPTSPQTTLVWAVRVLAAETVALIGLTIFLIYQDLTTTVGDTGIATAVTVYTAVMAALLGGLGWALHRRRSWARGPAIVLQLLLLPIGYSMVTTGLWLGAAVIAVGLCGAGTLLAPSTRAALGMR